MSKLSVNQSSRSILIANCHADTNRLMETLLWLNGYETESVETNEQAKLRLSAARFALLIARNAMPDGTGAELIEHAWRRHDLPSIAMTGTLSREAMTARITVPQALKGVLKIPFTHKSLLDSIAGALGKANSGPTQSRYGEPGTRPERCPDCHGRGQIDLLVRRVPCRRCNGVGEIRIDIYDVPLRHVHLIPPSIRFALHRSGLRTLREVKQLDRDEIQSRARLSDSAMRAVEESLR